MIVDKGCAERGCACYDKDGVEMIDLKENYVYLVFDETGDLAELYLPNREDTEIPEKLSRILNIALEGKESIQ